MTTYGHLNILWGWIFMPLGITSGAILGMWSFNGPMKTPPGFTDYSDLPRRMVRLAHIAFFMLPLLSIVYGTYIDALPITDGLKQIGSYGMLTCMVGVPLFLLLAALVYRPLKYLEAIPVGAGMAAFYIMAWGHYVQL
jgi:hypothetical protein